MQSNKISRTLIKIVVILFLVLLAAILIHLYINPYRGSVSDSIIQEGALSQSFTKQEVKDDLEYLYHHYKAIDYSFKDGVPEAFQKQYDTEINHLPDNVTTLELWQISSRIASTLDIAHDYCNYNKNIYYDVSYCMKDDVLYVNLDENSYKVLSINDVPIHTILENAAIMLSYENDLYKDYLLTWYLQSSSGLSLLTGKTTDNYVIDYDNKGASCTLEVQKKQSITNSSTQKEYFSYNIDKDNNIGLLTIKKCRYNKQYKEILQDFFTKVKDNSITNIAIDLRNNEGGSSLIINEFVKYLNVNEIEDYSSYYRLKTIHGKSPFHKINGNKKKSLIYDGNIYVLTSAETFSSAMNFSVILQDNGLAKVIGEPCGNKPSQYGEKVGFIMPHSKLYFSCSIGYFERPLKALANEQYQNPDYLTSADLAVEKLYEIIKGK